MAQKQREPKQKSSSFPIVTGLIGVLLFWSAAYFAIESVLPSLYRFDPVVLGRIAKEEVAKNLTFDKTVDNLLKSLDKQYPGLIQTKQDWLFNVAGGAMGQLHVAHISLSEYLIIFGSPIGTEGFSGRFMADDYFMILKGEQWAYYPGNLTKLVFKPGTINHMPRGQAIGYKMPDECFALEYARGWIPLMMPFGIADYFTSTLDFYELYRLFSVFGREVVRNMLAGKF
eukprot:TRINITY_DN3303_c0_g1_i2.p1 TRINITY_DN3303_c0_g1~~TRINITY_DN3303_c0_g1_i2.p1  ORF type:complete len:241 (-),score=67.34 TRINITY_DN3303_c0_g1_i2:62-745(-)